jgi:hypothetical protein
MWPMSFYHTITINRSLYKKKLLKSWCSKEIRITEFIVVLILHTCDAHFAMTDNVISQNMLRRKKWRHRRKKRKTAIYFKLLQNIFSNQTNFQFKCHRIRTKVMLWKSDWKQKKWPKKSIDFCFSKKVKFVQVGENCGLLKQKSGFLLFWKN